MSSFESNPTSGIYSRAVASAAPSGQGGGAGVAKLEEQIAFEAAAAPYFVRSVPATLNSLIEVFMTETAALRAAR